MGGAMGCGRLSLGLALLALLALMPGREAVGARLCIPECKHAVTTLPSPGGGKACYLIAASYGDADKQVAIDKSRQALDETMRSWLRRHGWSNRKVSVEAMRSEPLPFVRGGVTNDLYLDADIKTKDVHTTCWEGIVLRAVCTSASKVCS